MVWLLFSSWASAADDILGDQDSEATEAAAADSAEMVSPEISQLPISVRHDTPIIDGDLSDGFWRNLSDIPIQYEVFPVRLRAAGVSTNVRITLTDTHLYAAFLISACSDQRGGRAVTAVIRQARRYITVKHSAGMSNQAKRYRGLYQQPQ